MFRSFIIHFSAIIWRVIIHVNTLFVFFDFLLSVFFILTVLLGLYLEGLYVLYCGLPIAVQ